MREKERGGEKRRLESIKERDDERERKEEGGGGVIQERGEKR